MHCGPEERTVVEYRSEHVVLKLVYDERNSRQVNAFVSCPQITRVPLELFLILSAYGYEGADEIGNLRATTPEELERACSRLAELIREYALRILRGDRDEILFVSTFVKWRSVKYAWEGNNTKSILAAYPGMISSPYFDRVKATLSAEDIAILEKVRRICEDAK